MQTGNNILNNSAETYTFLQSVLKTRRKRTLTWQEWQLCHLLLYH